MDTTRHINDPLVILFGSVRGFTTYIFKKNCFKLQFGLVQVDVTNERISHLRDKTMIRCLCFHQNDETMYEQVFKTMFSDDCQVLCGVLHKHAHICTNICTPIYAQYILKWLFQILVWSCAQHTQYIFKHDFFQILVWSCASVAGNLKDQPVASSHLSQAAHQATLTKFFNSFIVLLLGGYSNNQNGNLRWLFP